MEEIKKYYKRLVRVGKYVEELERISFGGIGESLNKTEKKLILIVCTAKMEDKRVISTQIAKELGVTRSAVSQMVDKLEKLGYICRVASLTDKKIAYVELVPDLQEKYESGILESCRRLENIINRMGRAKFVELFAFADEFLRMAEEEKREMLAEKGDD